MPVKKKKYTDSFSFEVLPTYYDVDYCEVRDQSRDTDPNVDQDERVLIVAN